MFLFEETSKTVQKSRLFLVKLSNLLNSFNSFLRIDISLDHRCSQTTSGCLDPFKAPHGAFEDSTTPAADDVFRSQGKTGALEQGVESFLQIF